jgi:hypothetical protein
MRRANLFYDWPLFEFAIRRSSLYVLGAGASMPQIRGDFTQEIRRLAWHNGIYEGQRQVPSPLARRVLPHRVEHDVEAFRIGSISQNELDAHTPNNLVEILLARQLMLPNTARPPQYAFFDVCPPSILFNYNNDNLGDRVHPRHQCLRPHGSVDARWVHASAIDGAIRHLAIPDVWIDALDYHRPLCEPNSITTRRPYRQLQGQFGDRAAVVIIGYSFGAQPDGSIDDAESFSMLIDLLRWRPKPVLVVGPDPEPLAVRLESALRLSSVSMLRCHWNVLAEFVLSGQFARACAGAWRKEIRFITPLYLAFAAASEHDH